MIWPQIQAYVAAVNASKVSHPKNKSFESVMKACTDPLFLVRANIFLSIAQECHPFLLKYQADKPVLPFLADDLFTTVKHLLQRFVTDDTLESVNSPMKLVSEDVKDVANHKDTSRINRGFVADKQLKDMKIRKKVSERDVFLVRKETKDFLVTAMTKLLEKCPLRYTLERNLAWLDPQKIREKPDICEKQLRQCLHVISSAGHVRENQCDQILHQFKDFVVVCKTNDDAIQWPTGAYSRLDTFFHALLSKEPGMKDLWTLVQKVLLLSHGQASVERGFSINKNIVVTNMRERTVVAQRVIVDHLHYVGGVGNLTMTKELLHSASCARQRYHAFLNDEKKKEEHGQQALKRKAAQDELDQLKRKRKKIQTNIKALLTSADELAVEAEATEDMSTLSKSNAFRQAAREKEKELEKCDKEIEKKTNVIKS
ncbi:uncharacterized protein LOC132870693 isoform X1 [Neoarius graeffei]|uniref:uncharacterized protein LOC132870693 isoform X1 n=1 Tax=Neoarius graeffei TaxID=443677 RepID=UPI00298CF1A5|nr:uncharacterized protein LOC132870693 isoform X1 [Neoarius graeffei]XP_060760469.1 uncharacterized protein LOC132870693 isoform X1 [Neoarius graeffei]XP_060760470.1 uncharacterized protein LOC132870693 isoform X1 [Neoarius graeffei]XP_060760471.1 uncharacterized protein LOC132870693 isoform X1 [Neoarius graeffei]